MPTLPTSVTSTALFSVFQARVGFYAVLSDGSVVTGETMSKCCEAAQACIADLAVRDELKTNEVEQALKHVKANHWEKITARPES